MSEFITEAFVNQYTSNLQMLLQQKGSKLRPYVMSEAGKGKLHKVVEQIGETVAEDVIGRHGDTPINNTSHDGRWMVPKAKHTGDMVDDWDLVKTLINPTSSYAINHTYAMGRAIDDIIIDAALGSALTGESGTTSTAFDTANQQIAASSLGMTVAKLNEAREILESNEVDVDNDPLYIAMSAKQFRELRQDPQFSSADFNSAQPLANPGVMNVRPYLGFFFIHSERLGLDSSSNRRCFAFAKSGLVLGVWKDIHGEIFRRGDKQNNVQIYTKGIFGATRTEEGKVVEILCA